MLKIETLAAGRGGCGSVTLTCASCLGNHDLSPDPANLRFLNRFVCLVSCQDCSLFCSHGNSHPHCLIVGFLSFPCQYVQHALHGVFALRTSIKIKAKIKSWVDSKTWRQFVFLNKNNTNSLVVRLLVRTLLTFAVIGRNSSLQVRPERAVQLTQNKYWNLARSASLFSISNAFQLHLKARKTYILP